MLPPAGSPISCELYPTERRDELFTYSPKSFASCASSKSTVDSQEALTERDLNISIDHEVSLDAARSGRLATLRVALPEIDPLARLSASMTSTGTFLIHLQRDSSSTLGTAPEVMLQAHLHRLTDLERIREEQCRELQLLLRDLGKVRWEGVVEDLMMGRELGLGLLE